MKLISVNTRHGHTISIVTFILICIFITCFVKSANADIFNKWPKTDNSFFLADDISFNNAKNIILLMDKPDHFL